MVRVFSAALLLCALGASSSAVAAAQYGATLTVGGYAGTETLENFPVLLKLSESSVSGFRYADMTNPSTGADLWFSADAAGDVVLPHDIDEWHENGTSLVWVSVPTLKKGTVFYLHYRDSAPPEYAPSNVWLRANYVGVWHMNEASGNVADATGNGLTAVPKGTRAATDSVRVDDGAIGCARQNSQSGSHGSGSNNCYLQVAEAAALNVIDGRCTASQWVKMTPYATVPWNNVRVYSRKTGYSDSTGYECEMGKDAGGGVTIRAGGSSGCGVSLDLNDKWAHFVAVFDGTSCKGYGNGGATTGSATVNSIGRRTGIGYGIGSSANGGEPCVHGWLDEYRLRAEPCSKDWVKAEYDTATSASFLTAGAVFDATKMVAVSGSPDAYGTPVPNYGSHLGYEIGASLSFDAPAFVYLNAAKTERMACTGWKLYDLATGEKIGETAPGGVKTNCTFTFAKATSVVWQWKRECFVNVAAAGGTATESFWAEAGSEVTLSQTAASGRAFYGWAGDTVSVGQDYTSASLTFTVAGPVAFAAMYTGGEPTAKTYVGASGGSWDDPANWSPAGLPTVSDDVTIPDGKRVIGGYRLFAHSVTLQGSAAISQGGNVSGANESVIFTDGPNYSTTDSYGRYAASFTDETPYLADVLGSVTMGGSSQWLIGGHNSHAYKTLRVGGDFTMSGTSLVAIYAGKGDRANTPELGGAAFTVGGKATFGSGTVVDAFCNVNVYKVSSTTSDRATGSYVLMKFADTEVASGATLRSRLGLSMYTETALRDLGCAGTGNNNWLSGGSHGGQGGAITSTDSHKQPYDNELAPLLPGGSGSLARTLGGGVIRLDTTNLVLNGTIDASAFYGTPQHESGAPAGGSVWITCDAYAFGAAGALKANGKSAVEFNTYNMGGGAGGRIAIGTGLTEAQKTDLARTGTAESISSPSALLQLYPNNVSVTGGEGIRSGTAGEDGTAVVYKFVDASLASITVKTSPAGLMASGFAPAVNTAVEQKIGTSFTATAPSEIILQSGVRRLVTGWSAVQQDGTVVASGSGTTCEIASVPSSLDVVWNCEKLQYRLTCRASGNGTLTGAESGWQDGGETVTLTAEGASFRGWMTGTFLTPDEAKGRSLAVTVDRPQLIVAVFAGSAGVLTSKTYCGANNGVWENDANWEPAGMPEETDAVTIPAGKKVNVTETAQVGSLTLGEGAMVSVFGAQAVFYEDIKLTDNLSRSDVGRPAADANRTDVSPSVEAIGDITLGANAQLAVGGIHQLGHSFVRAFGNLRLGEGAKMSVYAGPADGARVVYVDGTGRLQADGTLSLATGAQVDLVGFHPKYAEKVKLSCVPVVCGELDVAAGAKIRSNFGFCHKIESILALGGAGGEAGKFAGSGHGGKGGDGFWSNKVQSGGSAYDSPYFPTLPGCLGRYDNGHMMSLGGGVIRVKAGRIRLAGELNADATIPGPYEYGGGSGGTICLACQGFAAEETAKLSAKGQKGSSYSSYVCGGGAGGRIAVCRGFSDVQLVEFLAHPERAKGFLAQDQTLVGAQYCGIADVSGGEGNGREGAQSGEPGTFYLVRPSGFAIFVR